MNIYSKLRHDKADQQGFTLIELLVVIGILAILLAITLIAINPNKHFRDARNTQRSSDVSEMLNAVYEYESANNGNLPPGLSSLTVSPAEVCKQAAPTVTCPASGTVDLCPDLVTVYIADLPRDPSLGNGGSKCAAGDYDTGYTIQLTAAGSQRLTVKAPDAESAVVISVTR